MPNELRRIDSARVQEISSLSTIVAVDLLFVSFRTGVRSDEFPSNREAVMETSVGRIVWDYDKSQSKRMEIVVPYLARGSAGPLELFSLQSMWRVVTSIEAVPAAARPDEIANDFAFVVGQSVAFPFMRQHLAESLLRAGFRSIQLPFSPPLVERRLDAVGRLQPAPPATDVSRESASAPKPRRRRTKGAQ